MIISLACDHGGYELKELLKPYLVASGHEVLDFGTYSNDSCDYPDFASKAALAVKKGTAERGIVICKSGIGVSIVANKIKGVRCSLVNNVVDAQLTREHNNANCLAIGAKYVDFDLAKAIIDTWLTTEFSGGRHQQRVDKIKEIEELENE